MIGKIPRISQEAANAAQAAAEHEMHVAHAKANAEAARQARPPHRGTLDLVHGAASDSTR